MMEEPAPRRIFASMPNDVPASAARIRSHRDLLVWQKAVILATRVFTLTSRLPSAERYGITSQLRRAAVSVAANIADGHGRLGKGEYVHALSIARGSLMEVRCLLEIAEAIGYLKGEDIEATAAVADEVARMLWALVKQLDRRRLQPQRARAAD